MALVLIPRLSRFELVVLAWSASRRGMSEAVVAGVVGSFAYNVTMTLGAGALAHPLTIANAPLLHAPLVMMVIALALVAALVARRKSLGRAEAAVPLLAYPVFILACLTT